MKDLRQAAVDFLKTAFCLGYPGEADAILKDLQGASFQDGLKVLEKEKRKVYKVSERWFHFRWIASKGWQVSVSDGFFNAAYSRYLRKAGIDSCTSLSELTGYESRGDVLVRKLPKRKISRIDLSTIFYVLIPIEDFLAAERLNLKTRKTAQLIEALSAAIKDYRSGELDGIAPKDLIIEPAEDEELEASSQEAPKSLEKPEETSTAQKTVSTEIDQRKLLSEDKKENLGKSSEDKKETLEELSSEDKEEKQHSKLDESEKSPLEDESVITEDDIEPVVEDSELAGSLDSEEPKPVNLQELEKRQQKNVNYAKALGKRLEQEAASPRILEESEEAFERTRERPSPKRAFLKKEPIKVPKKKSAPIRHSISGAPIKYMSKSYLEVLRKTSFYQKSDKQLERLPKTSEIFERLFPNARLSTFSRYETTLFSACLYLHKDGRACEQSIAKLWTIDHLKANPQVVKRMMERAILYVPSPPSLSAPIYDLDLEMRDIILRKILEKGWVDPRLVAGKLSLLKNQSFKYRIAMETLRAALASVYCLLEFYTKSDHIRKLLLEKLDCILKIMILRYDAKDDCENVVKVALQAAELLPDGKDFEQRMRLRFRDLSGFEF